MCSLWGFCFEPSNFNLYFCHFLLIIDEYWHKMRMSMFILMIFFLIIGNKNRTAGYFTSFCSKNWTQLSHSLNIVIGQIWKVHNCSTSERKIQSYLCNVKRKCQWWHLKQWCSNTGKCFRRRFTKSSSNIRIRIAGQFWTNWDTFASKISWTLIF